MFTLLVDIYWQLNKYTDKKEKTALHLTLYKVKA